MNIGDRMIDKVYGHVELLDVDENGMATLLIERTGAKCNRPAHWVKAMKKAPMKPSTVRKIRICLTVLVGIITVVALSMAAASYFAYRLSQQ